MPLQEPLVAVTVTHQTKTFRTFEDSSPSKLNCLMVDYADADIVEASNWLGTIFNSIPTANLWILLDICRARFNSALARGQVT